MSSEEILERAWDDATDPLTNTVRMTVSRLRAKSGDPPVIETVTSVGYRIGHTPRSPFPAFAPKMLTLRNPKTTVRWRLATLYGGLFLVSGAALLAITYALVDHATVGRAQHLLSLPAVRQRLGPPVGVGRNEHFRRPPTVFKAIISSPAGKAVVEFAGSQQRISDLHQLEIESGIALAIMALSPARWAG